ncbi:MAG: hypothetical protein M1820_001558 [Bogoriella megaspora]|nr:MAG: hypothetical protein M1820_001558 [Bogoriella megaspora]
MDVKDQAFEMTDSSYSVENNALLNFPSFDQNTFGLRKEKEGNSPCSEVRAAVPNYDEDTPANILRTWVLGLTLAAIGAAANTISSLRQPTVNLSAIFAQLASYFLGIAWARIIPFRQYSIFGLKYNTNPGAFDIKEHGVIVAMAEVSFTIACATDIILAQISFFKQNFGLPFQLLLVITTQSLGYCIAGLLRNFLAYLRR